MVDPLSYFSIQCSTTGVSKAMVYYVACVVVHIKDTLLINGKSSSCSSSSSFLSQVVLYHMSDINTHK